MRIRKLEVRSWKLEVNENKKTNNKKGQVWIETVTYTLIAFVLIGLVLGFARPKIEEIQDQAVIDQSINIMKEIDAVIQEISEKGVGNKRKVELTIRKGELIINSINDSLIFELEGNHMYSQPGQKYEEGNVEILTEEKGKFYVVTVEKNYTDFDIKFQDKDEQKKLPKASTAYTLYIANKGGENNTINFQVD